MRYTSEFTVTDIQLCVIGIYKLSGLEEGVLLSCLDKLCFRDRLEREAAKKHVEFAGRRNLGEIAKLYIKIESTKQAEVV